MVRWEYQDAVDRLRKGLRVLREKRSCVCVGCWRNTRLEQSSELSIKGICF
jgi:hypothetical protein